MREGEGERERERRRGRTVRLASFRFFLSIHSVRPYSGAEHNRHIGEGKGEKNPLRREDIEENNILSRLTGIHYHLL